MKYCKQIEEGFITAVGTGISGENITETEYRQLLFIVRSKPFPRDGCVYKLRNDNLGWELVELPPEPEPGEEEATAEDYEAALHELGVKL